MNPSVFVREVRSNVTYTLIWTVGFLLALIPSVLSTVLPQRAGGSSYDTVMALASAMGNLLNTAPIFSMILGSLVISKEQDERTIEFLLAHPVSRSEIAVSKLLAYTVAVAFLNVVLVATGLVLIAALGTGGGHGVGSFLSLSLDLFLLMYAFGAGGMLLSMAVVKGGAVVGYSVGIPLLLALLVLFQNSGSPALRALSYLNPTRYLGLARIMETGALDTPFVVGSSAIAVGLLAASVAVYRRKEFAV